MSPVSEKTTPASSAEAGIRQLIANGKSKLALDRAKEVYKAQGAPAEALLVDAYAARIRSLIEQDLGKEAKSLADLVRERFPASRERLETLTAAASARSGALDEMLKPLNGLEGGPALDPELRASIEKAIQNEVVDLAAVAECPALAPEHPLRVAAAALREAFDAVTSGPAAEGTLALLQVPRRSPLAPWKLLVRAIERFYARDDEACREYLNGIPVESAPARLVPAMQALLGEGTSALTPAASALVAEVSCDLKPLRQSLEKLDRSFRDDREGPILRNIQVAIQECRRAAPGLFERLKQRISVRCALMEIDKTKVMRAMGEASRHDADFVRLLARGFELSDDPEEHATAAAMWNEFRKAGAKEGWFAPNGLEVAAIYLHMAAIAGKLPVDMLKEMRRASTQGMGEISGEAGDEFCFLYPEILYQRACTMDPHSEAFAQWLEWARGEPARAAERVAETWASACPGDLPPILFLMNGAAKRGALKKALAYLNDAERIDGLNPEVRRTRARLLAARVTRQLQQKKPHLAEETLAELAALPQMRQGDWWAYLSAARSVIRAARGDHQGAEAARTETAQVLGSNVAAALLIDSVAMEAKHGGLGPPQPVERLDFSERDRIPEALAKATSIAEYVGMKCVLRPQSYLTEAEKQIRTKSVALGAGELRALGETGIKCNQPRLAYAASAAGLDQAGSTDAAFLLLRARALPPWESTRGSICASAAAELGRKQRDFELVDQAVEVLHNFGHGNPPMTLEKAAEVVRKEKAESAYPSDTSRGPDYSEFFEEEVAAEEGPCMCPACRRERGDIAGDFEDLEDDDYGNEDMSEVGPGLGLPPELSRRLFEEIGKAIQRGETMDEFLAGIFGGGPRGKRKKGRRK